MNSKYLIAGVVAIPAVSALVYVTFSSNDQASVSSGVSHPSELSSPQATGSSSLPTPEAGDDVDDADKQEDANPWGASSAGIFTINEPARSYLDAIDDSRDGDTDAMVTVSYAIQNCEGAMSSRDIEQRKQSQWDLYEYDYQTLEDYENQLKRIDQRAPVADDLWANAPDGEMSFPINSSMEWLEQAASFGHEVAQLQVIMRKTGDWYAAADLIDKLLPANDYRVIYAAGDLMTKLSPSDGTSTVEWHRWLYAGCMKHEECDASALQSEFESNHSASEYDYILSLSDQLEAGEFDLSFSD
ncbi:MAG: hypothetical protein AAF542_25330 [Pseudomonadota bacterium]